MKVSWYHGSGVRLEGARVAGRVAERLGRLVGYALIGTGKAARSAPGFLGACAVVYGAATIYLPAGWISAGLFLLLLDRRV